MMALGVDTYYRGYRLSDWGQIVYIYWEADLVDTVLTVQAARVLIDDWLHAR